MRTRARSAARQRGLLGYLWAAPERASRRPGETEAAREAVRDAHGAGKARLHSARPQPAETNLLREAHVDR